jgi:spermidine synthase
VRAVSESVARISAVRKATLLLFFVSGGAGLIYEVVWTRALGVVFGNTVFAVSTVLTAFMLGLAGGSWLFGRVADRSARPLRMYAWLQLGIGGYAFVFSALLSGTDIIYGWFFRSFNPGFYLLSLFRLVLSIIIILLPTVLMGGSLPVLSKLWAGSSKNKSGQAAIGQSVGLLYAVNTFGAVVGCFLCGYLLIRIVGVSKTIYLAATANILVGLSAFVLSGLMGRRQETGDRRQKTQGRRQKAGDGTGGRLRRESLIVLPAVGLAGFCALALEVLWTRVLVFVLGTTAYAFACMLTCFILGIALGSLVCSRLVLQRIRRAIFAFGLVEFLLGLSVLASILSLRWLWHIDHIVTQKLLAGGSWREAAGHFVDALIVLLVPTVLMGMAFPIAVRIYAGSTKAVGKAVGEVYASNTAGCVLGSFAAGFVMIPLLGLRDSFLVVVTILLVMATGVICLSERRARAGIAAGLVSAAALAAGMAGFPRDVFLRTMNTYHYPSKIIYIKDDATGTVTVHELPEPEGSLLIAVDGVDVAGEEMMLRTTQKLQAYVPLLVHERPRKVLQIGFGSGETTGVGLMIGVDEYNIVEICPGVFEAGRYFEEINRGSYRNPRLRKIIMDGKNFVKLTDEQFDVIMNDATYPGTTGSSALYTFDHLEQCRERLRPGGVLSCWVPLDLRPVDFRMIVRSFREVMPHCSLWMGANGLNKHAVLLGTLSPMQVDFERVKTILKRSDIAEDLAQINIHSVFDFLDCFVVDEVGLERIARGAALNTDDRPLLEFGAAIERDIEGCWIVVLGWLSENHSDVSRYVSNVGEAEHESKQVFSVLEQYSEGTSQTLRGLLGILQGDPQMMNQAFEMARKANPHDRDVESCLGELSSEVEALVKAVERTPGSASIRARLAKRYHLLGDHERAAAQYRYFLNLKPDNAAVWNNLGTCYNALQDSEKAVSAFEKAIAQDVQFVPAYFNLGEAYGRLGEFSAAARNYEKALSLSPALRNSQVYDKLARAYFMQKEYKPALRAIEEALSLAGDNPALRQHLLERRDAVHRAASLSVGHENAQKNEE